MKLENALFLTTWVKTRNFRKFSTELKELAHWEICTELLQRTVGISPTSFSSNTLQGNMIVSKAIGAATLALSLVHGDCQLGSGGGHYLMVLLGIAHRLAALGL